MPRLRRSLKLVRTYKSHDDSSTDRHSHLLYPFTARPAQVEPECSCRWRFDLEIERFADADPLPERRSNDLLICRKIRAVLRDGPPRDWLVGGNQRDIQPPEV